MQDLNVLFLSLNFINDVNNILRRNLFDFNIFKDGLKQNIVTIKQEKPNIKRKDI